MGYSNLDNSSYQEYVAPVIGNGNMALSVDYEGGMTHFSDKIESNPGMRIWWAGRRYLDTRLIPFGNFEQRIICNSEKAELLEYNQELDTENAVINTDCSYSGDVNIRTSVIVHHDCNLIAVRKDIESRENISYCFDYRLCGYEEIDKFPKFMNVLHDISDDGADITYDIQSGISDYNGSIRFFSDSDAKFSVKDNLFSAKTEIKGKRTITFYILFSDNTDYSDYMEKASEIKGKVLDAGFEKCKNEHSRKWNEYYREGYVITDDSSINRVYNTAQYHLKCYTTQWSIPVGLSDALWHGRYFAFDEFYMLMPLLSSNHIKAAYKPPHFRAIGLEKAIKRASSPHGVQQARYPWETLENGGEGARPGYWHDHVFHMACIAMTEYYYYKYTQDEMFLRKEGYPVIRACAMFYINQMLYESADGTLKAAKCTDLERLGASVPNGYMTMCAIIKTIEIFCETADILGLDDALGYAELPDRLIASLPNDGMKYIPYDGCSETSVGLMSGIYPFDVMDKDNEMQRKGIDSYFINENKTGNMYAVGTGVCPWYNVWKSVVLGRLGETEAAYQAVKSTIENTGNFDEMYEINDYKTGTIFRPWFGTAAGMFIQAVNEMFVKYENGLIYIGTSLPKEISDFSFRLAVPMGVVIEAVVQNGSMVKLRLTSRTDIKSMDVAVLSKLSPEKLYGVNIKKSVGDYKIIQCEVMED